MCDGCHMVPFQNSHYLEHIISKDGKRRICQVFYHEMLLHGSQNINGHFERFFITLIWWWMWTNVKIITFSSRMALAMQKDGTASAFWLQCICAIACDAFLSSLVRIVTQEFSSTGLAFTSAAWFSTQSSILSIKTQRWKILGQGQRWNRIDGSWIEEYCKDQIKDGLHSNLGNKNVLTAFLCRSLETTKFWTAGGSRPSQGHLYIIWFCMTVEWYNTFFPDSNESRFSVRVAHVIFLE